MVLHDVFNLLITTLWYTYGITLLTVLALLVYLTVDFIGHLTGGK